MTKDEAVAAIGQAMGFPLWQSSGNKIREILDQIDQPDFITSAPGYVLVRMTESDFRLLRAYWAIKEMFDDRSHSQGSQEGTTKATDGASWRGDPPRTDGPR